MINHCVKIKGCPPSRRDLIEAYRQLGIELPDNFIESMAKVSETFYKKYLGKPEFDESFYRIDIAPSSIHA